jgi:hypothetical protein
VLRATDPPWRTLSAYGGRLLELVEQLKSSLPLPTGSARGEHGIGRGVRIRAAKPARARGSRSPTGEFDLFPKPSMGRRQTPSIKTRGRAAQ